MVEMAEIQQHKTFYTQERFLVIITIIIIIIIIITAIQDQVTLTRNYKKYILKQPNTDELCGRCEMNRRRSNTLLRHVSN
jgi:hypothetical protein